MNPPNNARYLRAAQQRRRTELIDKVRDAVRELDATGQPITIASVVRASGASRAFIYRLPDIVSQIQKLRKLHNATDQRGPPGSEAATRPTTPASANSPPPTPSSAPRSNASATRTRCCSADSANKDSHPLRRSSGEYPCCLDGSCLVAATGTRAQPRSARPDGR